jgi:mannosidase alpha-like ER degradation enhancer 2
MMIVDLSLQVKEMFYHAFDNYMRHAFPLDELRPMSCTGEDSLGSYSLTLIDALDMLALLGDRPRFSEAVNWLGKNLQFGKVHLLHLWHILHA